MKNLEKHLQIAIEIDDRGGEGACYHDIGNAHFFLEQFENAVNNFVCSVNAFNSLRSRFTCKDNWKIKLRKLYETAYTALWR